jgi:RimJ/RimL family protein N-acetyltransferase
MAPLFPALTRDEVFILGTRRLWLRWPNEADAVALARIGGDPRVASKTATWPIGCDAAFAAAKIEAQRARNAAGTGFGFVLAARTAWSAPLGRVGFDQIGDTCDLAGGYHLSPEHWGQGLMTEAIGAVIDMIRLLTPTGVLKAYVMPDNPSSAAVLRKAGFARTGAGVMTTPHRGVFAVEHFERRLRRVTPCDRADTLLRAVA